MPSPNFPRSTKYAKELKEIQNNILQSFVNDSKIDGQNIINKKFIYIPFNAGYDDHDFLVVVHFVSENIFHVKYL